MRARGDLKNRFPAIPAFRLSERSEIAGTFIQAERLPQNMLGSPREICKQYHEDA
jgi:hypothetical protein